MQEYGSTTGVATCKRERGSRYSNNIDRELDDRSIGQLEWDAKKAQ